MQSSSTQLQPIVAELPSRGSSNVRPLSARTSQLAAASTNGVLTKLTAAIKTFWRRQISLVTGHDACRDHFANERTFLGYLRTSAAFATLGVGALQLFLLGSQPSNCRAHYGTGLALVCESIAIIIAVTGCWRFWAHQNAINRGKAKVGGWELNLVAIAGLTITILALVLVLLGNCD